ncbi:MAG TPA: methyltransferase [Rhizomicrobium sp.]|jgi:SAM-dependent methyltransferase|nr:methyltransferase [Rhizomicrobium sp.]
MSVATALALWQEGRSREALAEAWAAYDAAPDGRAEKVLAARILKEYPEALTADRVPALLALLGDRDINPGALSAAGWRHLRRDSDLLDAAPEAMARRLEASPLALALLNEDIVAGLEIELPLTAMRRWMLLAERWRDFPRLADALRAQAAMNSGAWLFGDDERARLSAAGAFADAFLPPRPSLSRHAELADPVTRAVAEQYEVWPYPMWKRVMANTPTSMATRVREMDPDGPDTIPTPADILIAGCGTGRQVALQARRLPGDRLTAIDVSRTSLRYAAERCAEAGLDGIAFRELNLLEVGTLGRRFDAILCTGVLHHLAEPEKGWAALAAALKPGGVMHVMLYSRIARLSIRALRRSLGALAGETVDDDVLRAIRRRVMALPPAAVPRSRDFHTLPGVYDLLVHQHEDPFDVPRIQKALGDLGLQLIHFGMSKQRFTARYRAENPHDPLQRDFAAWARAERDNPRLFASMYDFWCRKPLA